MEARRCREGGGAAGETEHPERAGRVNSLAARCPSAPLTPPPYQTNTVTSAALTNTHTHTEQHKGALPLNNSAVSE